MIAQSFLAVGESEGVEEKALMNTICLLWELPAYKVRAHWNRFAALRDPAVWDAYLLDNCGLTQEQLIEIDFRAALDETIRRRDFGYYRRFLRELECDSIFDYQMQLVMSTYPGWRVLFYHDIAHALTRSGSVADELGLTRRPVPLLPRAIAELGGALLPGGYPSRNADWRCQLPRPSPSRHNHWTDGYHRQRMPHLSVYFGRPQRQSAAAPSHHWRLRVHWHGRRDFRPGAGGRPHGDWSQHRNQRHRRDRPGLPNRRVGIYWYDHREGCAAWRD